MYTCSGEIIKMTDRMTMMFEAEDLEQARTNCAGGTYMLTHTCKHPHLHVTHLTHALWAGFPGYCFPCGYDLLRNSEPRVATAAQGTG